MSDLPSTSNGPGGDIERPIFLIGCPRSGTTITLQILAAHEQLGWISDHQHVRPTNTKVSLLNRVYDIPGIGKRLYLNKTQGHEGIPKALEYYLPTPAEPWGFWGHYLHNFWWERDGAPPRRRTPDDVTDEEIRRTRKAVRSVLRMHGKSRLLSKYTDLPRVQYLNRVFPDALFIHIVRDGRAVAASYHQKVASGEMGTWRNKDWWVSGWPKEWQQWWEGEFGGKLTFTAFQWAYFVKCIREDLSSLKGNRYIEVRYSDMMESTTKEIESIFQFAGLKKSAGIDNYVEKIDLDNRNYKWRERLAEDEISVLNSVVGSVLPGENRLT